MIDFGLKLEGGEAVGASPQCENLPSHDGATTGTMMTRSLMFSSREASGSAAYTRAIWRNDTDKLVRDPGKQSRFGCEVLELKLLFFYYHRFQKPHAMSATKNHLGEAVGARPPRPEPSP